MTENIRQFLEGVSVGESQSYGNMVVYCLLVAKEPDVDFVTLDEALETGRFTVTETEEDGSVPELRVANDSDRRVLLLDGEELIGAKQNRVLNVTVLIAPQSQAIIPVSCVEQGRWSYTSKEFRSAKRTMSAGMRKVKSDSVTLNYRTSGTYCSDQGAVWDEIDAKYERMHTEVSPTMALSDLYEAHTDRSEAYRKAFQPVNGQIGMAVFIDGNFAGLELVAKAGHFARAHDKLIQSYVMDALETETTAGKPFHESFRDNAAGFLDMAARASVHINDSVALGEDVRLEGEEIVGAGLQFEGHVLQLSVFRRDPDSPGRSQSIKMLPQF